MFSLSSECNGRKSILQSILTILLYFLNGRCLDVKFPLMGRVWGWMSYSICWAAPSFSFVLQYGLCSSCLWQVIWTIKRVGDRRKLPILFHWLSFLSTLVCAPACVSVLMVVWSLDAWISFPVSVSTFLTCLKYEKALGTSPQSRGN